MGSHVNAQQQVPRSFTTSNAASNAFKYVC